MLRFLRRGGTSGRDAAPDDSLSPASAIYSTVTELQRDQIAAQLEQANANDLLAVAEIATAAALVVGVIVVRVTYQAAAGWRWWWWPIPAFVPGAFMAGIPLVPPTKKRQYKHGPSVPEFLTAVGTEATVEGALRRLIQDLHACWANNDSLLARESWWLKWGGIFLVSVALATVGLYTWTLR